MSTKVDLTGARRTFYGTPAGGVSGMNIDTANSGLSWATSQKPHPSTPLRAGFLAKDARNGAPRVSAPQVSMPGTELGHPPSSA